MTQHANPNRAQGAASYMRDQFSFYGVDAPLRRRLVRELQQQHGWPASVLGLAEKLWSDEQREFQYVACDLLSHRKGLATLTPDDVPRLQRLVTTKSWWDTVDSLAPNIIGAVLREHPELVRMHARAWIASDNIWLQRTAIIMQLKYRQHTDAELLFECILARASSTEFFVRKGAGWALRQYAYTDAQRVKDFVEMHRSQLSGLTIREALKHHR